MWSQQNTLILMYMHWILEVFFITFNSASAMLGQYRLTHITVSLFLLHMSLICSILNLISFSVCPIERNRAIADLTSESWGWSVFFFFFYTLELLVSILKKKWGCKSLYYLINVFLDSSRRFCFCSFEPITKTIIPSVFKQIGILNTLKLKLPIHLKTYARGAPCSKERTFWVGGVYFHRWY